MLERVDKIISLDGLRTDDMSVADIRACCDQLPETLGAGSRDATGLSVDASAESRTTGDPAQEVQGLREDPRLILRRALELATSGREIAADEHIDALAESLTMIFRSVVAMSRRGHSPEQTRRDPDIVLGVLE